MNHKSIHLVMLLITTLAMFGCGGGGGGGSDDDNDTDTPTPLQLELTQGATWTFFWNTSTLTFSQPNNTTSDTGNGEFTITLGAPVTIAGETAYPLLVAGDAGQFLPRWTHVAVSANGSLLGSTNGVNLQTVYDANTGNWVGGGFFIEFAANEAVTLAAGTFNGEYNTVSALVAGHSSSDGGCETILGTTICSDSSTRFSENEYYKEGVGPIGYDQDIFYSSSGGNFFTSTTIDRTVELIATSLSAADNTVFVRPPWESLASLNTPRSGHSAVVLNGRIHVIGGFDGASLRSMEIYDPSTDQWTPGPAVPPLGTGLGLAEVVGGNIYVDATGSNDVHVFNGTTWSTVTPTPASDVSFGSDAATYVDATFGEIVFGVAGGSSITREVSPTGYAPDTNQWLTATSLMGNEWLRPSVVILGDLMYVLGGFGDVSSPRGAQERVMTLNLTNDTWTTTGIASMGTARDNMSASVLDGRIYAFGGNAVSGCAGVNCVVGSEYRSAEMYDPATNTWVPIAAMFTARKEFDSVVLNGQIYVIGGRSGGEYVGAVERYTPP